MGLCGQLAQSGLGMLKRLTLGAEGGIAQARTSVFKAAAFAETSAITATVSAPIAPTGAAYPTAFAAFAGTPTTARRCGHVFLHAGPVVTAHGHYWTGFLHRCWCGFGFCLAWFCRL